MPDDRTNPGPQDRARTTVTEPIVAARLPLDLIERIDVFAKAQEIERSEAIRRLLEEALKGF